VAIIFDRVKRIIVEQLGVEEEFSNPSRKIEIPDEEAEKIITVRDAVDYIRDVGVKED